MKYIDVRPNNRLEIFMEHENPALRTIQGIVLKKENEKLILISTQGQIVEVYKYAILSIQKVNFDRAISEKIVQLKKLYEEILTYEARLKVLKEKTPVAITELQDANFISNFNIEGAKHRLEHSIEPKLLSFENRMYYEIAFETLQNTHINIIIRIKNDFTLKDTDSMTNVEKLKKDYCPNEIDVLNKVFVYATQISLNQQEIIFNKNSNYSAYSTYVVSVEVNKDNFLRRRKEIRRSLFGLK